MQGRASPFLTLGVSNVTRRKAAAREAKGKGGKAKGKKKGGRKRRGGKGGKGGKGAGDQQGVSQRLTPSPHTSTVLTLMVPCALLPS